MAERQQQQQQPPPEYIKRMSLDKIIEAMTADLEGSSGHYAQFGVTPSSQTVSPNWNDYSGKNNSNDYTNNQTTTTTTTTIHHSSSLPTMNAINPMQAPIYMKQDAPIYNTDTGEQIYFPSPAVNHIGINENNDLIGAIDVGGGKYINVIYGNASSIVNDNCQDNNSSSYRNNQEYGLFGDQIISQHNNIQNPSTNGKQLIDNLVGNWVPNQSGTYSPFGGSPVPHNIPSDIDDKDKISVKIPQKKQRIVAEVKPMRPSYSAILTKSPPLPPPPPLSPLNIPQMKQQSDITAKKLSGKNSKIKNKTGLLKRQNSSGSDEHGSPIIQSSKKPLEKNNSNLPRRWVSLDNLGHSESHDINAFNRSDQFEKRKNNKTNKKNDTLNNLKIQYGSNNKGSGNIQKRSVQMNNNNNNNNVNGYGQILMTERADKNNQQNNMKNTKDDKKLQKDKNSKRFHAEKAQQIKKGQKYRKRDNRESPVKDLCKNINKYASRWSKIGLKVFFWLLHLISDVVSMSTNLVIQFIKLLWFHIVLYFKYSLIYSASTVKNIRFLNAIGKKIDDIFGNSKFAFWRKMKNHKNNKNTNKEDCENWLPGGLETNISLPSTGEEAMKRLLACKGKDPYSILGVTPTCSDDDIKKYYKRQAFLVHPDKNSQAGAEEAFKILVHAFDIIGEPERRQAFDQTRQVEAAWGELSDLLSQLHRKMEQAANTIRCTNCGLRHKRIPTQRPCYAARFCAQCKIRHSAKEGDIWAESRVMGFLWHYYACMEGAVYDVTDWAACQAGNLKHLRANTHSVQYRIVLGQRPPSHTSSTGGKKRQQADGNPNDAGFEDFLNNLYNQNKSKGPAASSSSTTATTEQSTTKDNRRRKTKRK